MKNCFFLCETDISGHGSIDEFCVELKSVNYFSEKKKLPESLESAIFFKSNLFTLITTISGLYYSILYGGEIVPLKVLSNEN
jgi:hypothetical protein